MTLIMAGLVFPAELIRFFNQQKKNFFITFKRSEGENFVCVWLYGVRPSKDQFLPTYDDETVDLS